MDNCRQAPKNGRDLGTSFTLDFPSLESMRIHREMAALLFATALVLGPFSASAEAPIGVSNGRMIAQIEKRGDAKFFRRNGSSLFHAWTVNCRTPLVNCEARQGALLLRLDHLMRPKLITMKPLGATVAIRERNIQQETPNLFSSPLTDEHVTRLSQRGSFLIVTLSEEVVVNAKTEGLSEVVDFLIWMSATKNRVAGDARRWRFNMTRQSAEADATVLDQHRLRTESEQAPPKFTVPYTKPQIQFATRAQQYAN